MVDWLDEARGIGEHLRKAAISLPGGALTWAKSSSLESPDRLKTLGPHLYNGSSGVALFFAALFHALGDVGYRELALQALIIPRGQLTSLTAKPETTSGSQIKLGGLVGLGSFIYSFLRIGAWLKNSQLIEEACNIATLISPESIETETSLDVMYGTAGAILSLLAIDREAPAALRSRAQLLERASTCGEYLLRKRIFQDKEFGGWSAGNRPPQAGFAHGAAGISRALAILGDRTGRAEFWQAAQEGFAFERRFYSPERRNWRCSSTDEDITMVAWCNGAPGIVLGRLCLPAQLNSDIRADIEAALETTATTPDSDFDFLCCGNLGRADILAQASHDLESSQLLEQAREIAFRAILRARSQGNGLSVFSSNSDRPLGPGFFRGLSGIGYTLLRLSSTVALPCVLALE